MEKKKVSPFEYAIRTAANPEDSKQYEPFTPEEVYNIRQKNMEEQARRLRFKLPSNPNR